MFKSNQSTEINSITTINTNIYGIIQEVSYYLSLLTILVDNSLLEILFSGLDGPPLDIALKLPVMLDCSLQQPTFIVHQIPNIPKLKIEYQRKETKFKENIRQKLRKLKSGMKKRIYPITMPAD